jgi:hypothetical protein
MPVRAKDLAYYDAGARRWVVERVAHRVLVGPSSRDSALLEATLAVVD